MTIFLDTSSLLKLYQQESGTKELVHFLANNEITSILLSEITKIEFSSAVWKKVRTKELSPKDARNLLSLFKTDSNRYRFLKTDRNLIEKANQLISKYGMKGLRTLDSIQLASGVMHIDRIDLVCTDDKLLNELFNVEGFSTYAT